MQPTIPPDILAELLALRPDIERILADRPRGFCPGIEDKLQLVMLKVIKHFPSYQPHEDGLKPWVSRISHNVKLDAYRGKQRSDETFGHDRVEADFAPSRATSPERDAQVHAFWIRVCDAIIEMPEPHQEVLILVAIGEMSHEDAAERLGITKDAAKMRLSRAREYLRKRVGSIDDHIGVIPLITSNTNVPSQAFTRRALTLAGHVGHLWPPLFAGICALSQMESSVPVADAESKIIVASTHDSTPTIRNEPHRMGMAPPNTSIVPEPSRSGWQ